MDDTTKSQNPTQQVSTPTPGGKERVGNPTNISEWVNASTPEIQLPQEVKDAGVKVKNDLPRLTPQEAVTGVRLAKEATPIPTDAPDPLSAKTPHPVIKTLMQVHKNVKESVTWLLRLINKEEDRVETEGGTV